MIISEAEAKWAQQFRCGCFLWFATKRSIPRGCPHHMRDRQGDPIKLIKEPKK